MRDHVCVDIETLGTCDNPCILQIAAVAFNLDTRCDNFRTFNVMIDMADKDQGKIDGATLRWWLQNDEKVREKVLEPDSPKSLVTALCLFRYWIEDNAKADDPQTDGYDGAHFWACGVDFDFRIIRQTCERLRVANPIPWSGTRDFRTMKRVIAPLRKVEVEDRLFDDLWPKQEHDALYDAASDAQWLQRILNSIPKKR